jgi:uncharacterized protein (UPF0332 family)
MTVKPRDLLDQAIALQNGAGELDARTAISKAYYAALHRAAETTPNEYARPTDSGGSHERLIASIERLANSAHAGRTPARELARLLRQMRKARTEADYDLDRNVDPAEVNTSILRAEKAFSLCADIEKARGTKVSGSSEPPPPAKPK